MKQLIEFIPLALFFIVYTMSPKEINVFGTLFEIGGPYSAAFLLMISSIFIYGFIFLKDKKLAKMQLITLVFVVLLSGLTLFFKNEKFLQWKAPIVNLIFALVFLMSHFIGNKVMTERIMGHVIQVPKTVWNKINLSWVIFFIFLGTINLLVVYLYPKYWVHFKVIGSFVLTLIFIIIQAVVMMRYHKFSK